MNNNPQDKNDFSLALTQLNQRIPALNYAACIWITTIINTINYSVILLDKKYKILMFNQTTLNLLGYSENELINQSIVNILDKDISDFLLLITALSRQ